MKRNSDLKDSLSRGLSILECFTTRQPRLSPSQIQSLTNIPRATIFRLLKTLAGLNYLRYDEDTKKYFLGPSVLRLGFSVLHTLEARELIRPYLESLSRKFNKSIGLLMLDNCEMVYVERVRVPSLREFNISVGSRIAVYPTAAGKAFLAHLNRERLAQIIDELNKDEKMAECIGKNAEKLLSSLNEVRRQGYSINNEELFKGVRGIAVSVFSSEGIAYAINVAVAPEEVSLDELRREYAPELMDAGKKASKLLGQRDEEGFASGQE